MCSMRFARDRRRRSSTCSSRRRAGSSAGPSSGLRRCWRDARGCSEATPLRLDIAGWRRLRLTSMAIALAPDVKKQALSSIKQYVAQHLDQDLGDLQAGLLLDYFLK